MIMVDGRTVPRRITTPASLTELAPANPAFVEVFRPTFFAGMSASPQDWCLPPV